MSTPVVPPVVRENAVSRILKSLNERMLRVERAVGDASTGTVNSWGATVNSGTSSVSINRRNGSVIVSCDLRFTGAPAAGGLLINLSAGYRPVTTIFGDLVDANGEVVRRIRCSTTGDLAIEAAGVTAASILRGQIVLPL